MGGVMPQIEIPFTPGQRVRTVENTEFVVGDFDCRDGAWHYRDSSRWWRSGALTLVEPVIEWERNGPDTGWLSEDRMWYADDNGMLMWETHAINTFDNPRAVYWMVEGRTLYRRDLGHEWTPVATVSKPRALAQKIIDAIEEALIESLLEPTHD